jgi:hypothetical protein
MADHAGAQRKRYRREALSPSNSRRKRRGVSRTLPRGCAIKASPRSRVNTVNAVNAVNAVNFARPVALNQLDDFVSNLLINTVLQSAGLDIFGARQRAGRRGNQHFRATRREKIRLSVVAASAKPK